MAEDPAGITELLNAAQSGDSAAQETAYALVYDELKRCARRQKAFVPGSSLSPTALVSELYLRLSGHRTDRIRNRAHFFALAARAMRQIVIEHARRRGAQKRGGNQRMLEIEAAWDLAGSDLAEVLEIDTALRALEQSDADLARLVELYFFAGLTFDEIAEMTGRSERTVRRNWELAKAFLRRELHGIAP
jgi:RNA polymerase sigma factor (TIGR02999 family)